MAGKGLVTIIEDDLELVRVLKGLLAHAGYRVTGVTDSTQALAVLREQRPDIVILDLLMPQMDGFTILDMIRRDDEIGATKVIILTGKVFEADKRRAAELGADIYMEKPFEPEELLGKVEQIMAKKILIRFWGVRGSIASPGPEAIRYGGNTSCVEVRLPNDQVLIFDAGTGIRTLGNRLIKERKKVKASIFISHPHWDHIQGLPFFTPAYKVGTELTIYGSEHPDMRLDQIISAQMESVYFPVQLRSLAAHITFIPLSEGKYDLKEVGATLEAVFNNHPGLALAYGIYYGLKKVVYMTDNELDPIPQNQWAKYVEFVRSANLLIHDAQYTEEEYKTKRGWGHSSWPRALALAIDGKVERLVLFHHDPDHSDSFVDSIWDESRSRAAKLGAGMEILAAREGMEIQI